MEQLAQDEISILDDSVLLKAKNRELATERDEWRNSLMSQLRPLLSTTLLRQAGLRKKPIDRIESEGAVFSPEVSSILKVLEQNGAIEEEVQTMNAIHGVIVEIRNTLVVRNFPLMWSAIGEYRRYSKYFDEEERESIGHEALIAAADRWDTARSEHFSTVVYVFVKNAFKKALHARGKRSSVRTHSLDKPLGIASRETGVSALEDPKTVSVERRIHLDFLREELGRYLKELPEVSARIVQMRIGEMFKWQEIVDVFAQEGVVRENGKPFKKMHIRDRFGTAMRQLKRDVRSSLGRERV